MIFAALNQPYPNSSNTRHFFQQPLPVQHTYPEDNYGTERALQNATFPTNDNVDVPKRPEGVTTTICSPFPDANGGRTRYSSDGETETELESEGVIEDTIDRHRTCKFNNESSDALCQSPLLQRQVAQYTSSDPLETSPDLDRHSRPSSISDVHHLQRHHATEFPPEQANGEEGSDVVRQDGGQNNLQQTLDDLETSGRFTSASETPDSQRKDLIVDHTDRHGSVETEIKQSSDAGGGENLAEVEEESRNSNGADQRSQSHGESGDKNS